MDLREPLLSPKKRETRGPRTRPLRLDVASFLASANPVEYTSPHRLGVQKEAGTTAGISPRFLRRGKRGETLVRENTLVVLLLACIRDLDARLHQLEHSLACSRGWRVQ